MHLVYGYIILKRKCLSLYVEKLIEKRENKDHQLILKIERANVIIFETEVLWEYYETSGFRYYATDLQNQFP